MRPMLLVVAVITLLSACAASTAPLLSDAERCRRFSGFYSNGTCRAGAP